MFMHLPYLSCVSVIDYMYFRIMLPMSTFKFNSKNELACTLYQVLLMCTIRYGMPKRTTYDLNFFFSLYQMPAYSADFCSKFNSHTVQYAYDANSKPMPLVLCPLRSVI